MRKTECTRNIECELNEDELLDFGQQLSQANQRLAELEDKKKEFRLKDEGRN